MVTPLKILIVEDSENDAKLLLLELRRGNWDITHDRVDTAGAMTAALKLFVWDLIITDYSMPAFSGADALALARQMAPGVPFILVSGTVGEEMAVAAMRAGADDYLFKGDLKRLIPVVERELRGSGDRRRAIYIERELKKRELQLAEARRVAGLGTWHLNLCTGVGVWSDEVGGILGRSLELQALTLDNFLDGFEPASRAQFADSLHHPTSNRIVQDAMMLGDDGAARFVQIFGDIIRDSSGAAIEASGLIQDCTPRKRAEAEMFRLKEVAETASRSKSEFLANMSHEIRTPISAILGFADMLSHNHQDEAARGEYVQIIQRNAAHLLELINEILDLSKIEAMQMKVERVGCNLPELFSEVFSLMRPRAVEKGLCFKATFLGPIPRVIQTDPTRLRQILVNLIGNAIKFTNTGAIDVRISNETAGTESITLCVEVLDSGIGMTSEQLSRLFEPFTQGDESITRKFGGTGLGLTISKRLAQLLNGSIRVTSEVGVGSKFTVKIDGGSSTAAGEILYNLTESTLPVQTPGTVQHNIAINGRILLVEDGRDNQRLLRSQLRDAGAVVACAENGQFAVEMAMTQPFDLILMDMQMPIMDGYSATAELRRRGLKTPIIALTAFAMSEDRAKCLASGCNDYLSKPAKEEMLLRTVNQHLGRDSAPTGNGDSEANIAKPQASDRQDNGSGPIKSSLANNPRMQPIIIEFVDGLPGEVGKMKELLDRNDLAGLQKVVHQLRGASGGYGFEAVTEPATKAEDSINTAKPLEAITADVESLIEVIRRIDGFDESKVAVAETAK